MWVEYRAECFRVARAFRLCFSCRSPSHASGLILPAGYRRTARTTAIAGSQTFIGPAPVCLIHVNRLNRAAHEAILHITGRSYHHDHDPTVGLDYFANHCQRCDALFRDTKPTGGGSDLCEHGLSGDRHDLQLCDVHVPIVASGAAVEGCPLPFLE